MKELYIMTLFTLFYYLLNLVHKKIIYITKYLITTNTRISLIQLFVIVNTWSCLCYPEFSS